MMLLYSNMKKLILSFDNYDEDTTIIPDKKIHSHLGVIKFEKFKDMKWYRFKACPKCLENKDVFSRCKDGIDIKPKNHAKQMKSENHVLIKIVDPYHCFSSCSYAKLVQLCEKDNYIQELIEPDRARKIFFDIDGKCKEEVKLNEFISLLSHTFPEAKINICGYEGMKDGKPFLSYHVCISNYHLENKEETRLLYEWVVWLKENGFSQLDQKVYDTDRPFKCVNQSKGKGSMAGKIISGSQDIYDHLVTYVSKDSVNAQTFIPQVEKEVNEIIAKKTRTQVSKLCKVKVERSGRDYPLAKKLVGLLNPLKRSEYESWLLLGICLKRYGDEGLQLWHDFCKKMDNYDAYEIDRTWPYFIVKDNTPSIGSLIHWARQDNPEEFKKLEFPIDSPMYKTIKFEADYIIGIDEVLKDRKSLVSQSIDNWMNGENKSLVIISPYNTGKTKTIVKMLSEYAPQKVCFITYRQSLSYDLHRVFGKLGFQNYLDKNVDMNHDRLICQIESLRKIPTEIDWELDTAMIKSFDLIILDEIESDLYHFDSSTIRGKLHTFDIFDGLLMNCKKILALDGDFGNRGYCCLKPYNPIIIENIKKKGNNNYIFTKDMTAFEKAIDDDLENGNKLAIISMSSTYALKYNDRYKNKYKVITHCARSDDALKDCLRDVNKSWGDKDLVIYSPSVEAGVSFDTVDYFDKKYVILSNQSCSPRALMQMISRIRHIKDNNIMVYLNGLLFHDKARFYSYYEVASIVHKLRKNGHELALKQLANGKKGLVESPYYQIEIYNELENINSRPEFFVALFIKLLTDKGNTWKFDEQGNKNSKRVERKDIDKDELIKAKDIDALEAVNIECRLRKNKATREDKIKLIRYNYRIYWNLAKAKESEDDNSGSEYDDNSGSGSEDDDDDEVNNGGSEYDNSGSEDDDDDNSGSEDDDDNSGSGDDDRELIGEAFFNKWYRKSYVLHNLKVLKGDTKCRPFKEYDDKGIDINLKNMKLIEKLDIIKTSIKELGFDLNKIGDVIVDRENFENNMKELMKSHKLFTDKKIAGALFNKNFIGIKEVKTFLEKFNAVLHHYGLHISHKRIKKQTNKNRVSYNSYNLTYWNNINKYLC